MPPLIWNGEPGTVHVNTGTRLLFQFHCNLSFTCGLCWPMHMAVGSSFPIPIHRGCRCNQTPIFPGQSSQPFVDFREMIRELDPSQQAAVMGRSNLRLVESGVVGYGDVVTPTRIRDLREVVSREKLTVEKMVKAGVNRRQAETAYATVHTPPHELAEARRQELIDKLRGKGIADEVIRRAVAERLAARVGLGGKGGLGITPGPVAPKPPPRPAPKPVPIDPIAVARDEQRARNKAASNLLSPYSEYAKLRQDFPDLLPPGPIEERLKQYTLGDAKVKAVAEQGGAIVARREALRIERESLGIEWDRASVRRTEIEDAMYARGKISAKDRRELDGLKGRVKEISERRESLRVEIGTLRAELNKVVADVLRVDNPVAIRPEAVPPGYVYNGKPLVPMSTLTERYYGEAKAWLEANVARGNQPELPVKVGEGPGYRAHYSPSRRHIRLAAGQGPDVIVHEHGHLIEDRLDTGPLRPEVKGEQFLNYRVGNEPAVDMRAKFGKGEPGEMGRKDKFDSVFDEEHAAYYTGRDYGRGNGTEVIAMGMQLMYNDPVRFAKGDPEWFKFTAGIMDGSLR